MLKGTGKAYMMTTYFDNWRNFLREASDTSKVVKAVITNGNKILLLKNDQGWDLPGGHVHEEESLDDALKREIKEETGLEIEEFEKLNLTHDKITFYRAKTSSVDVKLSDEHTSYIFIEPEKIEKRDMSDLYGKAVKKVDEPKD